ncbi:MAG: rhodanese-like domain-containing protein [Flavobacteriales bacterium]
MKEITVSELKARMDANDDFQLIDVREVNEYEYCNIGGDLIPMGEIMMNLDKISRDKDVVIHCKSGGRSSAMVQALMSRGFDNVINLRGGIMAWAAEVDQSIPTY